MSEVKHPVCGHMMPEWIVQKSGPCVACLVDVERAYLHEPYVLTWEDIRGARAVLLERTDWIETNPGRVARSPPAYVAAVKAYRQTLFDLPQTHAAPRDVAWPVMPS